MARRLWLSSLVATLALLATTSAFAQKGDSGSIVGYVMDQNGNPLKGVKLTITGDTQIGGKKVAYTNDDGAFRFPVLEPGIFNVKAEAPKLATYVQNNVKVGINAPTEVDVTMEVATKVEEVQVVQKAPVVSTTTANVKEVYDIDMVDSLPHDNRDVIFSQLPNYSAGTIRSGRIRGGGTNQTIYTMDGFNMLRQYPTLKASAAYEIQTAAYGAENAMAPGGMVNLVTRSGSNRFEFEADATADSSALRFFKNSTDSLSPTYFYVFNPTVSGPIVKDRLWYSVNAEFLDQKTGRDRDVEGILPDPLPEIRLWYKGTIKLTWQINARNKISSVNNFDNWWQYNRSAGLGYDESSQSRGRSIKWFTGLVWESLLTDALVFRSQVGLIQLNNHFYPQSCVDQPTECDFIPSETQKYPRTQYLGNANTHNRDDVYSMQFINRIEYFVDSKRYGEHDVQLKNNFLTEQDINRKSVPGDYMTELQGTVPEARTYYFANDPRTSPGRYGWYISATNSIRNSLSLSDAWRPTRHLTFTPGVAFTSVRAGNNMGATVINGSALTPSIAAAWDATHDGRTVLRASFNQYVDADVSAVAMQTLGAQVQQRCNYNTTTGAFDTNCVYSGGATGATWGLPCGPTGYDANGTPCRKALTVPRTWEYTVGGEREVVEGMSLGLDAIYRLFANQYEKYETNRVWNDSGSALDPTGGYRNGRNTTVNDLETLDSAKRRYLGITGSISQREGNLKIHAAYTWSRLDGTVLDGSGNRYGDIAPRDVYLNGPLGDDHRHEIKVNANYRATRWLAFGVRYMWYSGTPLSHYYYNNVTGSYDDLRATTGYNPGTNVNDPVDDRPLRLPAYQTLNTQIIFNLQPVTAQQLEVFVDVLNVLAQRTVTTVSENDNDFGAVRATDGPLRARFGLRYRY